MPLKIFGIITVELSMRKMKTVIVSCMHRTRGANAGSRKTMYICWDFNTGNLPKHNTHNYTRTFWDYMYSFGHYPIITKPSRITDVTATLTDNIFTNELQLIVAYWLLMSVIFYRFLLFAVINLYVCLQLLHNIEEL